MLVEACAPDEAQRVAGLQRRVEPRRPPAAHEAQMAPVRPRHHFDDRRSLAVSADADDEPFVAPFHAAPHEDRRWAGGGTRESLSATASASPDSAPMKPATPGQPAPANTQPPTVPATLEPR